MNSSNSFISWCNENAPGFYDQYKKNIVFDDGNAVLVSSGVVPIIKSARRPTHHYGIVLCSFKKKMDLRPAFISVVGPFMKRVIVNEQGGWLASCGKDVLKQSVIDNPYPRDTIVAIVCGEFYVAIGQTRDVSLATDRAVHIQTDIGKQLHSS